MDICEDRSRPKSEAPQKAPERPAAPVAPATPAVAIAAARWSRVERAVFLRQLALMFASGVNLFKAVAVLSGQARRPAVRAALEQLVKAMESGLTLSAVMERSRLFTPLQVGTMRIGEATGQLGQLLESLARLEEQEVNFQRKLVARLSYPVGVLLAVILGLALLAHVMGGALASLAGSLPGSQSVSWLLGLGRLLASPWFVLGALGLPLGAAWTLRELWHRDSSRAWLEQWLLKVAPFGPLWRRMLAARLCRLLAVLITSGVRADKTLELVAATTDSPAAWAALKACQETLREGAGLATAMQRSRFFPPEVIHMAAAGEESGRLSQLLDKVADYCEVEVERFLEMACAALEPLAMGALGVGVGAVILVTFAPIYQLLDNL